MPRVTITRRRRSRQPNALTAAAQRVDPSNPSSFRRTLNSSVGWQAEVWRYIELVGELQYYLAWRSWSASRCRLVASALDDQGAPMGDIPEDDPNGDAVRKIVNDMGGGVTGQAKIIQRASYLVSAIGECWVGMVVRDAARETTPDAAAIPVDINRPGFQKEQWYVFNRDQIQGTPNGLILKLPDGTKHEFADGTDILFRVWAEHPIDPSLPFSTVWSCRVVLNSIVQAHATIQAANNSRLVGNGLLFVPQEMSLPTQQAPVSYPSTATPPTDPPPYYEPNSAQALQDLLFDVAGNAKRDPESQAAMLPIIAAVPGDMIKNVNWIRPGSDIPTTTLQIQDADIRRLAMGLDVAPERLLGMSQGNHWSAWAIDETDIKVHVAPLVELIASALTQEILRAKLVQENIDPDQYIVWYDTTALTTDPDKTNEARDAFDRGAITAAALRQHFGFDDEDGYDYSSAEGIVAMALDKMAQNPSWIPMLEPVLVASLKKMGIDIAPPPPPPPALPPGQDPNQQDQTQGDQNTGQQPPDPNANPDQSSGDQQPVQAAAVTIARYCVNRALELANKRRRTRADAERFRSVPIELAHTVLEPCQLGEASDLIKGWATGLIDSDLEQVGLNPDAFRNMVEGIASLALVTSSPPSLTPAMLRRI